MLLISVPAVQYNAAILKSFNIHFITEKIGERITSFCLSESEINEINTRANTDITLLEVKRLSELEDNDRKKKKLREDFAYLRTNKLTLLKTGVYSPEAYLEEENILNSQLIRLQESETISDQSMHETVKEVVKLSELLKTISLQYSFADCYEKEEIIKLIFSELYISDKTLKYKCKNGFKVFENRLVPLGDPTTWLSEAQMCQVTIKRSIQELDTYFNNHPPPA